MQPLATPAIDHLVIAAATLDEGVAWCEDTLGLAPGPGGAHPLMGTHNRLLSLGGSRYPDCYLEIIAIDPRVRPRREPGQRRWFDLDDAGLQAMLARQGPRLIHAVARVSDVRVGIRALAGLPAPIDRGTVIDASRDTPEGRLQWRISVRDDGQRLFDGALPTLIEWGAIHPAARLPRSPLELLAVHAAHPRHADLREAMAAIGLQHVLPVDDGPADLMATLRTPRGLITLHAGEA